MTALGDDKMSTKPDMPFRFLDLPAEIRNMIYEIALLRDDILIKFFRKPLLSVNLLRASKQVYREAREILYGTGWFFFKIHLFYPSSGPHPTYVTHAMTQAENVLLSVNVGTHRTPYVKDLTRALNLFPSELLLLKKVKGLQIFFDLGLNPLNLEGMIIPFGRPYPADTMLKAVFCAIMECTPKDTRIGWIDRIGPEKRGRDSAIPLDDLDTLYSRYRHLQGSGRE